MAGFFLSSAEESITNRRGVNQPIHLFQPYATRFFLGVSWELFAHFPEKPAALRIQITFSHKWHKQKLLRKEFYG